MVEELTSREPAGRELSAVLGPDAVSQRSIDRCGLAHDVSPYLLVPHTVVAPSEPEEAT